MKSIKKIVNSTELIKIDPDFDSKFFRVQFSINIGSGIENDFQKGYAHFVEHAVFGGNPLYSREEIIDISTRYGGNINAFTSNHQTCFVITVLKEYWKETMDLLLNLVFFASFSEETLLREKKVVIEELHDYEDDPDDVLFNNHFGAIYKKSPLAHPIVGYEDTINSITFDSVKEFYSKYYVKENLSIYFSGVPFSLIFDYMSEATKLIPSGEKAQLISDYTLYSKNNTFYKDSLVQSKVVATLEIEEQDIYAAQFLNHFLGEGMTSYLFNKLRIEKNLCYRANSSIWTYPDINLMTVYCSFSDASKKDEIIETVNSSFSFLRDTLTQEMFDDAYTSLKSSLYKILENCSQFLGFSRSLLTDNHVTPDLFMKNLSKVTLDDVKKLTNKLEGSFSYSFLFSKENL